jgi:hypothetical protein
MQTETGNSPASRSRRAFALTMVAAALALPGCSTVLAMGGDDVHPPAASEFGAGPRASARSVYAATLEPREPIGLRKLLTVPVRILDAKGRPVEGATVSVEGGMPEHRHGLPTQPRVTRSLGGGVYEIEGLRFSMGGWWQVTLLIDSPAGVDSVTFNLAL